MSILTDYYQFERVATKAKTRLDCTASTGEYPKFEENRATRATRASEHLDPTAMGSLVVYFNSTPAHFGGDPKDKADKCITLKGKNLSSVYVPDPSQPFGFGDSKGTSDALLFVFHELTTVDGTIQPGGVLDVFVARGQVNNQEALCNLLSDGQLDEEIKALKRKARADVGANNRSPTNTPPTV